MRQGSDLRRERTEARIAAVPCVPAVLFELVTKELRPGGFYERVASLLDREPSLAVSLVASVNRMDPEAEAVLDLPQAVARLGLPRAGQMIASLALLHAFVPASERLEDLWRHSLQVATTAREIARATGHQVATGEAYLAGLLHDIGRFVLIGDGPEDVLAPELPGWTSPAERKQAERDCYGYDHGEIGARICAAWSVPEELTQVVRLHHEAYEGATPLPARVATLLRVLQQADQLTCVLHAHPDLERLPPAERLALLESHCMHSSWDWIPAPARTLDLLIGPIVARGSELLVALGLQTA